MFHRIIKIKQAMKFIGIIPARYASSRFPGKPLAILGGKMVIERVYRQVEQVLDAVYVATDDERIYKAVESFGGKALMTSTEHKSGTDRICEAISKIGGNFDVAINIQGDEPFIQTSQIETVMNCFSDPQTQIQNPNSPKIVLDNNNYAMYFSRSVIPFIRGKEQTNWLDSYPFLKHIGLYAYRTEVLKEISRLPQSSLELAESLGLTASETIGIDTPEDLQKAEEFLKSRN